MKTDVFIVGSGCAGLYCAINVARMLEGKENLQKHLNTDEYSIVAIDSQGKIYKSENLKFSS